MILNSTLALEKFSNDLRIAVSPAMKSPQSYVNTT